MTDSLENILRLKKIDEPEEFQVVKKFVKEQCGITPKLQKTKNQITIYIPNAAMAGNLQFEIHKIQRQIAQKLVIRIG